MGSRNEGGAFCRRVASAVESVLNRMRTIECLLCAGVILLAGGHGPARKQPETQFDLDVEAGHSLESAEREMTRVLSQLRARASGKPEAIAVLDKAQSAWTAYRDAQLHAMWPSDDKQGQYGSVFPMCFANAKATLTNKRTVELKAMLSTVEGEVCGHEFPD